MEERAKVEASSVNQGDMWLTEFSNEGNEKYLNEKL